MGRSRSRSRSLVDAAVGTAEVTGQNLAEVLVTQGEVSSVLTRAQLDRLLDPVNYLGAAGPLVDRMLASLGK